MRKLYNCNECSSQFEEEETFFEGDSIRCPVCGKAHSRSGYSEVNFCPNCREMLLFPLDLPAEQQVTCPKCDTDFFTTGFSAGTSAEYEELKPGTLFDKYRIIRLLGRGGMGEVYLAQDRLLDRKCALKILSLDTETDSSCAARFIQEAKLGDRLNHPNIVRVYNVGTELKTGRFFIAMEYVNGDSLSHLSEKRKFTETELLKIGITVCGALEAMAETGVVHRDIKPSNIMMTGEGDIKLMDLGIAKSEDRRYGDITLTQNREVFGTPEYASPEQCQAAHLADHRSDLYSLGATLYSLASGEPPYDGKNTLEIILKVLKDPPKDLHRIAPELSSGFVALIQWMMMRDPAKRPQSAADARARMEALLTGEQNFAERSTRKKILIGTIAAAVVLLGIVIMVLMLPVKKDSSSTVETVSALEQSSPQKEIPGSIAAENTTETPAVQEVAEAKNAVILPVKAEPEAEVRKNVAAEKTVDPPAVQDIAEVKKTATEEKCDLPVAKRVKKKKTEKTFVYKPITWPPFDQVLAKRLAKCEARLNALRAAKETNPDKQAWNKLCIQYALRQQALLKEQINNRKLAHEAAKRKYSAQNSLKISALIHDLARNEKVYLTQDGYERLIHEMLKVLADPQTHPRDVLTCYLPISRRLLIRGRREPFFKKGLQKICVMMAERHVLIPDSFGAEEPELIRYGVPVAIIRGDNQEIALLAGHSLSDFLESKILRLHQEEPSANIRFPATQSSALHYAVMNGWTQTLMWMIMAGEDVNATDDEGQSALHWAVKYGRNDFIQLLLVAGCDPEIRDQYDRKYTDCKYLYDLFAACKKREWEKMQINFHFPGDADMISPFYSMTFLQYLCYRPVSPETILFMLENGADPAVVGFRSWGSPAAGRTPLSLLFSQLCDGCHPEAGGIKLSRKRLISNSKLLFQVLEKLDQMDPTTELPQLSDQLREVNDPLQPQINEIWKSLKTFAQKRAERLKDKGAQGAISTTAVEKTAGSPVVKKERKTAETETTGYGEPLDKVLKKRLAKCEARLNALRAVKETNPDKQAWNDLCIEYRLRQQALLKEQLHNRKLAWEGAKRKYSAWNKVKITRLLEQICALPVQDVPRTKDEYNRLTDEIIQLLGEPQTDPQEVLRCYAVISRKFIIKYRMDKKARIFKKKLRDIRVMAVKRYTRLHDYFGAEEPELIRYGVPVAIPQDDNLEIMLLAGHSLSAFAQLDNLIGQNLPQGARSPFRRSSSLHRATWHGWGQAVMGMVINGECNVNAVDDEGQTALHWAVKYGKKELIPLLLAAGCNPEIKDKRGRKYTDCAYLYELLTAGRKHNWDQMKAHFRYPEDADTLFGASGTTLLQCFCKYLLSPEMLLFMLEHGADPTVVGRWSQYTPLALLFNEFWRNCCQESRETRRRIIDDSKLLFRALEIMDQKDSATKLPQLSDHPGTVLLQPEIKEIWERLKTFAQKRAERLNQNGGNNKRR